MSKQNIFNNKRQSHTLYQDLLDKQEAARLAGIEFQRKEQKARKLKEFEQKLKRLSDENTSQHFDWEQLTLSMQYIACCLDSESLSVEQYNSYLRDHGLNGTLPSSYVIRSSIGSWPAAMRQAKLELPERE
jgi:hypothetical protein